MVLLMFLEDYLGGQTCVFKTSESILNHCLSRGGSFEMLSSFMSSRGFKYVAVKNTEKLHVL